MTFGELFKFGFRLGRKIEGMTFEEYGEYICTPRKIKIVKDPVISSAPVITMIANDSRMKITFFEYMTFNQAVVEFAEQNIKYFRGFEQDNAVKFIYKNRELPNTVAWRDFNLSIGWQPWDPVLCTAEQSRMNYSENETSQWFNTWMWLICFPTIPVFAISYFLCWMLSGNSKVWIIFLSLVFLKAIVIFGSIVLMGKNIIHEYFSSKVKKSWYNFYSRDYMFQNYDLVYEIVRRINQHNANNICMRITEHKYNPGIEIIFQQAHFTITYDFSVQQWRCMRQENEWLDQINWKGVDLE